MEAGGMSGDVYLYFFYPSIGDRAGYEVPWVSFPEMMVRYFVDLRSVFTYIKYLTAGRK
jgi:L-asparagine transporter-like permease